MIKTALSQARLAASLIFGVSFDLGSLDHLIDALRATQHEFGALEADEDGVLRGPALDEDDRRAVQFRRFSQQARRAARETTYYAELFGRLGLDPARLGHEDVARLPVTLKGAIRDDPDAFVRRSARVALRATTTGTTGRPTGVCFSAYELRVTIALEAMHLLATGSIGDEDIVQLSTSSRATLGNTCFAGACARVGALVCPVGLVGPDVSLAHLAEPRGIPGKRSKVSVLLTYPSYLGELTTHGLAAGYRPADFGLERIVVGGEIVTQGVKARCQELFGPVRFDEGFGMTELWGMGGQRCPDGHLHFEPTQGLLEVLDPDTGQPARPGEVGVLVGTPFAPYRDATVVLRYDTEDLVRVLPEPPSCSLRHLPATTDLLGRRRLAVRYADGWVYPRDVLEALEAVSDVPLPARCGFRAVPGGVAVEVAARRDAPDVRASIIRGLEARGVPVRDLRLVQSASELECPFPLRGDLREAAFGGLQPQGGVTAEPLVASAIRTGPDVRGMIR